MRFYKYHGAGNDFLIADNRDGHLTEKNGILTAILQDGKAWSRSVTELCDRRYGVGADGLMLLETSCGCDSYGNKDCVHTDFRMVYFNSDGSGGMMCGNGGRCIVAFAADMGVKSSLQDGTYFFEAADGMHAAQVLQDDMGLKIVRLKMKDVEEAVAYERLTGVICPSDGWFLDTGTRHFVRQVKGLDTYNIKAEGSEIRYCAEELQPVGANVNFIESEEGVLKVRTYEKGVEDETFACGTGIVASAVTAYLSGISPSSMCKDFLRYDIKALRDDLCVEFRPDDSGRYSAVDVYLTGPAAYIAEIRFDD